MQALDQIFTRVSKSTTLVTFVLLGFGGFFRFVYGSHYGVGFDQVQIFTYAQHILAGDMTLIGPRTGPAQMFTGPLIYYLFAPTTALLGDLSAMVVLPTFFAVITGMVLFRISRSAVNSPFALALTVIWAFSPFLVEVDRILWNPNLLLLSSGLVFFSLIEAFRKASSKKIFFQLLTGSFLAYQAHFSGFILVGIGIALAVAHRLKTEHGLALILGLIISLIPTLLFDYRNDFLNTHGLLGFLLSGESSNAISIPSEFLKNGYILAETAGKLLFAGNATGLLVTAGLTLFSWSVFQVRKQPIVRFSMIWLLCIMLMYTLYQKEKPEYYFLISVPAVLTLWSESIQRFPRRALLPFAFFFCASATIQNIHKAMIPAQMSAQSLLEIQAFLQTQSVRSIEYDFSTAVEPGPSYLLSKIPRSADGAIYRLSYPNHLSFSGVRSFGSIGVWRDLRDLHKNSFMTETYVIETPKSLRVYQDRYPQTELEPVDMFILVEDNRNVATLAIASISQQRIPWVQECVRLKNDGKTEWYSLSSTAHLLPISKHCALLTEKEEAAANKKRIILY